MSWSPHDCTLFYHEALSYDDSWTSVFSYVAGSGESDFNLIGCVKSTKAAFTRRPKRIAPFVHRARAR